MQLSHRLETLLEMTGKCRCLADIGTDHGFIPIESVRRGLSEKAIASDVAEGPVRIAKEHVRDACLTERIDVRLGDGLSTLEPGEADTVLIAGMGGLLMERLLREGEKVLEKTENLILSPHTDAQAVRKILSSLHFVITDENFVIDAHKFYPVIRAEKGQGPELSETECLYGPVLLKKRTGEFLNFIEKEIKISDRVIAKIGSSFMTEGASEALEKEKHKRRILEDIFEGRI